MYSVISDHKRFYENNFNYICNRRIYQYLFKFNILKNVIVEITDVLQTIAYLSVYSYSNSQSEDKNCFKLYSSQMHIKKMPKLVKNYNIT